MKEGTTGVAEVIRKDIKIFSLIVNRLIRVSSQPCPSKQAGVFYFPRFYFAFTLQKLRDDIAASLINPRLNDSVGQEYPCLPAGRQLTN